MTDEIPDKLNCKNKHLCIAKADTGASNHYWRVQDQHYLHDIKNAQDRQYNFPTVKSYTPQQMHNSPSHRNFQNVQNKL